MARLTKEQLQRRLYLFQMCIRPAIDMCNHACYTSEDLGDISLKERSEIYRILGDAEKKIREVLV